MANEKPKGINYNSNVYYNRDGVVTKAHGNGEKVVRNPKTIAAVVASSAPAPTPIDEGRKAKK